MNALITKIIIIIIIIIICIEGRISMNDMNE